VEANAAQGGSFDRLREHSIGLPQVLFQSITHMAPGAAVAYSIYISVPDARQALPLAVALALVACLCAATAIGQLAKLTPSAGGLYAYAANSLGPWAGFLIAWLFILFEPLVAPFLYLEFGWAMHEVMSTEGVWHYSGQWWIWVFVMTAVVFLLTYRDIRLSTAAGVLLGVDDGVGQPAEPCSNTPCFRAPARRADSSRRTARTLRKTRRVHRTHAHRHPRAARVAVPGDAQNFFSGFNRQPGVVRAGERLPELARAPLKRAASMIPAGLSMVVAVAKTAPYFSLADVARYLNPRLETGGHAMFEGPLDDSSSLIFYLNRRFFFVNQNPRKEAPMGVPATDIFLNEQAVLDKWGQPEAVYLIVEQSRADYWKQLVISRFHVYHQVTTSGTYVVLSNQL